MTPPPSSWCSGSRHCVITGHGHALARVSIIPVTYNFQVQMSAPNKASGRRGGFIVRDAEYMVHATQQTQAAVGTMLGHRRKRWTNIVPTSG